MRPGTKIAAILSFAMWARPSGGAEKNPALQGVSEALRRARDAKTASSAAVTPAENPLTARIRALMARHFKADGPGAAVAVIRDGRLEFVGARGLAAVPRRGEPARRLTADRAFDLASCSKQFTAMAVLLLAQDGKLSLDDEVHRWVPEILTYDRARPIRVRDLLNMTSGLADYLTLVRAQSSTLEQAATAVGRKPLQFRTGSRYTYSNTDYMLLGLIVRRASGVRYGDFLRARIFDRLGMTHTAVLEGAVEIPNRVYGYRRNRAGYWLLDVGDTPGIVGDGGVFSTLEDLALWDRGLRAYALLREPELRRLLRELGVLDSGVSTGYSAGWAFDSRRRAVWHTGGWNGTSTYILRFLDKDLSVIVLSNWDEGPSQKLGDAIAALYD